MPIQPFSDAQLMDFLGGYLERVLQKIRGLNTDYVLKASPAELEGHFIEEARLDPLVLHSDQITLGSQSAIDIEINYFNRAVMPGDNPYVRGTLLRFDIPYTGTRELWRYRPWAFATIIPPKVDIRDDHISFYHHFPDDSPPGPEQLKAEIEKNKWALQQAIREVAQQVSEYNERVPGIVKGELNKRIEQARSTTSVVEGLGVPLKRTDTLPAYAVPLTRRPSPRALPSVETQPYKGEHFLTFDDYEYILGVTKSMGLAMERAPQSFAMMDEEDIRNHFLLQLNGHYEGSALGETFNASGKTDILIRVDDKNIFIGECKFWDGAQTLQDGIDQLLGYLTWRDSKCALFIFNQNRDSGAVAEKMHSVMQARPECKKYLGPDARGDHRYIFVKPSEPGREIVITTQLSDVPRTDSEPPKPRRGRGGRR